MATNSNDVDKAQILFDAKECFMATSIKKKNIIEVLTKCVSILYQDECFSSIEATDLFFHITRLFQYKDKDPTLRRLIYLGIKLLSQQAENVYVVIPILTSEVNSSRDESSTKAAAMRVLCQITDASSTLETIDDYLRQSLVDKNQTLASAAITSLARGAMMNEMIASPYTSEIKEALRSGSTIVQYHALGLLYNLCKNEQSDVSELISQCIEQGLNSSLANCLLIKIITRFLEDTSHSQATEVFADYVKDQLDHDNTLVNFEAATSLARLKSINESHRKVAVSHLRNYLTSDRASLRFASVRCLNGLACDNPLSDIRYWSVHRIGGVCKLHLLNKRYKSGDHITGILDFSNSNITCAKYTVVLQCEEIQQYELKQEFSLGVRESDFMLTIPVVNTKTSSSVLHCVLSFLFYIADKNYPKTLYEDRSGTIELGPSELDTKLFSCDFPIAVHCN